MKRIKPPILGSGQIIGNYRVVRELLRRHYPPFYEALELPSNQPMLLYPVRPEMTCRSERTRMLPPRWTRRRARSGKLRHELPSYAISI